jgi:outer membrane protein assembly factor BamB
MHPDSLLAVIPSFVLVGPLALVAALFPGAFTALAGGLRRWRAFLVVASVNSLFAGGMFLLSRSVRWPEIALFNPTGIAAVCLLNTLLGMAWAGLRYRRAADVDAVVTLPPRRKDLLAILAFTGLLAIALAAIAHAFGVAELWKPPMREFTAIGAGLVAGTAYTIFRMATRNVGAASPIRLSAPGELAGLMGMFAFTGVWLVQSLPRDAVRTMGVELGDAVAVPDAAAPKLIDATLLFETAEADEALSSAVVTPQRIVLGGSKQTPFGFRGVMLALDRTANRAFGIETPTDLRPVYSTPLVVGTRVYFGEGLHRDTDCRLFCFDLETGKPVWTKTTRSHTEGQPVEEGGRIYFPAGDDGLYCVNAATGEEVWHYQGIEQNLHIDSTPVIADGKLYAGSGYSTFAAICLDAKTGKELRRRPLPLRSFGTPVIARNQLILGLGTGNLSEDLSTEPEKGQPKETHPAGLILALDPGTGQELWKYELTRSVHTQLGGDSRAIYAACRDGWMYALERTTGKLLWKFSYGSPLTAGPVVASFAKGAFPVAVYAVSADGQVFCHSPTDGKVIWTRSIAEVTNRTAKVMASPTLSVSPDGLERTLYVPAQLTNRTNGQQSVGVIRFVDRLGESW